ncbi:BUB3-interacting and GLEBS motif-containing protein ZNF207 [Neolecta irregularis DAH-3]|uniref:BUB3-interacting and GLEBS motif-containing protein ZNF207 n=1 Tax=Neolecta irregularis (strain DAH-3) TaxID=1198029 RepID=A0A1U7LS89_NEOID|nr:BUB3-interacting and GLEBS motif-containing protein ZNF207 [Neolecta irregularis DAH-3]|eukprot:OLL25527.1 BUB3-interacting and GLEBS motif-containing protein ZNF207 [Neolecta irregularis DAH-3]
MARKKKGQSQGPDLSRPWCYHCDRDFDDIKVLIAHQKAKHYKCPQCPRKLNTPIGFAVHIKEVHKKVVTTVENAIPGRDCCNIEIFGMDGIPESETTAREARMWQDWNQTHGTSAPETSAKRQKFDYLDQIDSQRSLTTETYPHTHQSSIYGQPAQPYTYNAPTGFPQPPPPTNISLPSQISPPIMEPVTKGIVKFPRPPPGAPPPMPGSIAPHYRPPIIPAPLSQYPTHNLPLALPVSNQPVIGPQPPPPAPSKFYPQAPGVTKGVVKFPPPGARQNPSRNPNSRERAQSLHSPKDRSQRNGHRTLQKQRHGPHINGYSQTQGSRMRERPSRENHSTPTLPGDINLADVFGLPAEYAAFYKTPSEKMSLPQRSDSNLPSPSSTSLHFPLSHFPKAVPPNETAISDQPKQFKLNTEPVDMNISTKSVSDFSTHFLPSKNQPKKLVYLDPNFSPEEKRAGLPKYQKINPPDCNVLQKSPGLPHE